jgi:hypothetical protein
MPSSLCEPNMKYRNTHTRASYYIPVGCGRRSHIDAAGCACLFSENMQKWSGRTRRSMVQQCGNAMHANCIGAVLASLVFLLPSLGIRPSPTRVFSELGCLLHSDRLKRHRGEEKLSAPMDLLNIMRHPQVDCEHDMHNMSMRCNTWRLGGQCVPMVIAGFGPLCLARVCWVQRVSQPTCIISVNIS